MSLPLRYVYLATLADWSEIEQLLRSTAANSAADQKRDLDRLIDERLAELSSERWEALLQFVDEDMEALRRDASRYRWLCNNNFDRDRMQILTFQQWTEPHSVSGEPQPWSARVRGGALDVIIDAELAKESKQ